MRQTHQGRNQPVQRAPAGPKTSLAHRCSTLAMVLSSPFPHEAAPIADITTTSTCQCQQGRARTMAYIALPRLPAGPQISSTRNHPSSRRSMGRALIITPPWVEIVPARHPSIRSADARTFANLRASLARPDPCAGWRLRSCGGVASPTASASTVPTSSKSDERRT
ncbi:hypothetical protein OH76DRAFT_868182 [Lentinus brumalis]|uniref:Uncharacterized protein n=1 Tax=Lentinus brumalis TaxID=2498619 RepID=A0A371DRJ8_9APHY|nr:hypothetical protein OH76DRAFT_868182 [Polyporus brumalis]